MIKKIFVLIAILFSILFFSALHVGLTYLLPFPFSKLNVIFVFIVLLIAWWESGWVVWIAFFSHIFIELFSLTPFGLTLMAATLATLFSFWLYQTVITNRSFFAALLLCFFALLIYRGLYTVLLFAVTLITDIPTPEIGFLAATFGWEILFSILALGACYVAAYPVIKRFRPQALSLHDMYGT